MVAILKFFKRNLPNRKSDWAETWWEASEQERDSEWLKSFRSNIQDGCYSGHLENLETTSAPEQYVGLNWNLGEGGGGGTRETRRFRAAKFVQFRHLRFKLFKWHLLPNRIADCAQTWLAASDWHRDSELWNYSGPISEMAPKVAVLKIFKSHLLPNGKSDWA